MIHDGSTVLANGVTVSAMMPSAGTGSNAFGADATSGAGVSNVGVAGSLALNTVDNSSAATVAGGAVVNAGTGAVLIEAQNLASNTVSSGASVAGSGSAAKVGGGRVGGAERGGGQHHGGSPGRGRCSAAAAAWG